MSDRGPGAGRGLSFGDLRRANIERCEGAFHPLDAWSLTDWMTAVAGECGEAANVVKKLRRLEIGSGFVRWDVENAGALQRDLADEIADTVIYLDLLAARAGIDLGLSVAAKFNRTSERVGSEVTL